MAQSGRCTSEPVRVVTATPGYLTLRFAQRHRVALRAAVLVVLAVTAGGLFCLMQWQSARLQRDVALEQARRLQADCQSQAGLR